jgi:photosynthetic reaction center cytochrome c subunit
VTRFLETPIGRIPTEIDYTDYRAIDSVKIPFRWTIARPQGSFTIQIDRVENNVPLDDSRFAKPPGSVPASAAQPIN